VRYAYYDGTQQYGGNAGDLMTAAVLDGSGNFLDTSYFRYYTAGATNGYPGRLKYVFPSCGPTAHRFVWTDSTSFRFRRFGPTAHHSAV
jgi:hypothetical protein